MNAPHPPMDPRSLGLSPERLQRIAAALNAEVSAGTLPGAVLAIARHGKTGYFESFGYLDPAARSAMPRDAIFSIASMTKPIVTVGALMLYEEGRLMVNEPVGKYLPQLARMQVAAPRCDEGNGFATVPPVREMTIQDLMRHTSGLAYGRGETPLHKVYPLSSDGSSSKWTGAEFLGALARLPLHYQPGSSWEYGLGLDVLGLAIEAVTGMPLSRYLEERIFAPLGMTDTAFVVPPAKVARYAKALPVDPVTRAPQTLRDGTKAHKFDCGGGCVVSTAAD